MNNLKSIKEKGLDEFDKMVESSRTNYGEVSGTSFDWTEIKSFISHHQNELLRGVIEDIEERIKCYGHSQNVIDAVKWARTTKTSLNADAIYGGIILELVSIYKSLKETIKDK